MFSLSGTNSTPCQTSKIKCFANILNYYRKTLDLRYWQGSEYATVVFAETSSKTKIIIIIN